MIFQIYDLLPSLVSKASTARYGGGKKLKCGKWYAQNQVPEKLSKVVTSVFRPTAPPFPPSADGF